MCSTAVVLSAGLGSEAGEGSRWRRRQHALLRLQLPCAIYTWQPNGIAVDDVAACASVVCCNGTKV